MKAIAEYFRDLASDDRYFGAEPPQPDAEMMARIAQREIARQVEARSGAGGIHLRAAAPQQPPPAPAAAQDIRQVDSTAQAAATPAAAAAVPSPASRDNTDAPVSETAEPAQTATVAEQAPETEQTPEQDGADQRAPDAASPDDHVSATPPADPEFATDVSEGDDSDLADSEAILWGLSTTLTPTDDDTDAASVPSPRTEAATAPAQEQNRPAETPAISRIARRSRPDEPLPAGDSIAAKLQRIRAVVAKTPVEDDFAEDEHADSFTTEDTSALQDALSRDIAAEDDAPAAQAADAGDDSVSALLDRLNLTGDSAPKSESPVAEDAPQGDAPLQDDDTTTSPSPEAAADPQPEAPQTPAEPDRSAATTSQPDAGTAAQPPAHVTPKRPVRGRVIRVKRAQVDANLIESTAQEVPDQPPHAQTPRPAPVAEQAPPPAPKPAPPPSSLSDDDEADLMAELAAVEADLLASTTLDEASAGRSDADDVADAGLEDDISTENAAPRHADDAVPADEAEAEAPRAARELLVSADTSPDGDLSRLMAAANDRLSDEDATSSRETYNQLRAAVAAAQADSGDDEARREARTRAFREDLASVVRPRRADGAGSDDTATPATSQPRPAPLKLVAEQRIDARPAASETASARPAPASAASIRAEEAAPGPAAPATPVRPRRVASALLQDESTESGLPRSEDGAFDAYAAETGAVELQELLEAAASYLSFVEGRESFSRPQLINKVRMLEGHESFNREDSLRSFGQLLREGKLKKASNGRFSVSSQIGFKPENRAAG